MSDPTAATSTPRAERHQRRLANYLLDKKLQLRYVIMVTLLSGLITGTLGYMIFDQRSKSTDSIQDDLEEIACADAYAKSISEGNAPSEINDVAKRAIIKTLIADGKCRVSEDIGNITGDFEQEDRFLVYKMIGAGIGLVVILSLFLIVMTHKVAGPLFKTSLYFDRMAKGRLGYVTPLRQGDMLQDFYGNFKAMHDAVRMRALEDIAVMERALEALRKGDSTDSKLVAELGQLEAHIAKLKKETDSTRRDKRTGAPADAIERIRRGARGAFFAAVVGAALFVVAGGFVLFTGYSPGGPMMVRVVVAILLLAPGLVFGAGAIARAHVVENRIATFNIGDEYLHPASTASMLGTVTVALSIVALAMYVMALI